MSATPELIETIKIARIKSKHNAGYNMSFFCKLFEVDRKRVFSYIDVIRGVIEPDGKYLEISCRAWANRVMLDPVRYVPDLVGLLKEKMQPFEAIEASLPDKIQKAIATLEGLIQ
jgi:hypothetical protein